LDKEVHAQESTHRDGRDVRVIVGLALPAFSTGSVGTASGFEDDDANLVVNSTFDWNGFDPVTWSTNPAAPYRTSSKVASGWSFKGFEDAAVSATDSGFAGGVKQDNDCGTYKPSKAPNKDDLKRSTCRRRRSAVTSS
jgi:hypothetical protein